MSGREGAREGRGLVRGRVEVGGDSGVRLGVYVSGGVLFCEVAPLRHGVPPTRGYYAVYYAERKMCRQASSQ